MYIRWTKVALCLLGFSINALSQTATPPLVITAERLKEPVIIDGSLSEPVWRRPGLVNFTQKLPNEGAAPSQKTEVWLAYDDAALYVAARMYDTAPDSIIQILGRRDADVTADWFTFDIDPYHDRRSGFFC